VTAFINLLLRYTTGMTKYVALLRGIGPGNPNMRNDKLRGVFENLGFNNVKSVISSGNVVFESNRTDMADMEYQIEKAWPQQLGFTSSTIIRSYDELLDLVAKDPFKGYTHSPKTYLTVTFLKRKSSVSPEALPSARGSTIITMYDRELCATVDTTSAKTPELMSMAEKHLGKEITTRTWKTVERICKALEKM
jgi:uncharacterized protein (DUF1697 family)